MLKKLVLAGLAGLAMGAAVAQEHADEHEVSVGDITIVHPWARAAAAGADTLVFFEIENTGAPDKLTGAATEVAGSVEIVGATMTGGESGWQLVGPVDVSAGDFDFDPNGLGLQLKGLTQELAQGGEFELALTFEHAGEVHVHVEVERADATQHSHAGHSH
jgi:copper(I)-binding protein